MESIEEFFSLGAFGGTYALYHEQNCSEFHPLPELRIILYGLDKCTK